MCRLLLPPEKKGLNCDSAVKQETAIKDTTTGTTLSTNVASWKMVRAGRTEFLAISHLL